MTTQLSKPKRRVRSYMPSAKSLANLKPFKPGENGHGGYPLKVALGHILNKPYSALNDIDKSKLKVGDVFVLETVKGAILREPAPFHEVWDRAEGKVAGDQLPPQNINIVFVIGKGYRQLKEGKDATE